MITQQRCLVTGCNSKDFGSPLYYEGREYCKEHYREMLVNDLISLFNTWDGFSEPPDRLKYLIGRFYSEYVTVLSSEPWLTKDIVHHRSYDWKKLDDSVVFTVIRYPVNKRYWESNEFNEFHHKWGFNPTSLEFTHLSQRKVG